MAEKTQGCFKYFSRTKQKSVEKMIHELGASFLKLGVPFETKFSQAKFEQEFFRRNENQTKTSLRKDFL